MFLLDLLIKSLFLTDIWVILYINLLRFFNTRYPAQILPSNIGVSSSPEPFEVPLYIGLVVLFILLIWQLERITFPKVHLNKVLKIILLFMAALLFKYFIGTFPLANQLSPYIPRDSKILYFNISFFYLVLVCMFISITFLLSRIRGKFSSLLLYVFLGCGVALLTLDAGFPMTGHDYEYFMGPVWEVASGKTIYVDIPSQYAFLTVVFLALLYKLHLFSLYYLPAIIWVLYIIQYLICFHLIKNVSKSILLALIGLMSIMTLNYFSLSHLPSVIPQIGPLRWLPLLLTIFFLQKQKKLESVSFLLFISLMSLFTIDVGIALILSYVSTIFISLLNQKIRILSALKSLLFLITSLISLLLVINLINLLFGYKSVDIIGSLYSLKKHVSLGLTMMPIQLQTYFWIVLFIYFYSLIMFFRKSQPDNRLNLIVFVANISLFAGVYFVGRSHPHNLFNISLFPLLNIFLLLSYYWKDIKQKKLKLFIFTILYVLFIIFPVSQRKFTLTEMILNKIERVKKGNIFKSEVQQIIKQKYAEDLRLIKQNFSDPEIILLSADDTYLLYESQLKNLLNANPIRGIDQSSDIDNALVKAVQKCPSKIVIDCSYVGKCSPYTPFVGVSFDFNLILSRLEKSCGIKYNPNLCSNHLCITEKQKT